MAAPERILKTEHAEIWIGDCLDPEVVAGVLAGRAANAVIVDAPYSERTHRGHDDGVATTERVTDWARRKAARGEGSVQVSQKSREAIRVGAHRRELGYVAWSVDEVARFVDLWVEPCNGWAFSLTDHVLARVWEEELERLERYVFSPLACVESGSRFRASGDGPSQWSVWGIAARPRSRHFATWGALDGAYVVPPGYSQARSGRRAAGVAGAKPLWLMSAIVRDYSRPDDIVVDPCAGGGTTIGAAVLLGRYGIGVERDRATAELAAERVAATKPQLAMHAVVEAPLRVQTGLAGLEEP